jgi:hypothetical protein
MNKAFLKILLILAIFLAPALAPATTFLHSKSPGFESDTIYDDDVYISGVKIKFDSKVHGDLFGFSYEMVQTDTIDGNFMSFGYSVENLAPVTGSLRVFAANASCNSEIGRNLLLLCQNINLGPNAIIGRDADLLGQNVAVQGSIGRNLKIKAQNATVSGAIAGDLNFEGDSLSIIPNTSINGNLNYKSASRATIGEGVKIGGQINWTRAELEKKPHKESKSGLGLIMSWVVSLKGYLIYLILLSVILLVAGIMPVPSWLAILFIWIILGVCGNLVIFLSKRRAMATEMTLASRLFPSLGLGFILLFLVPVVALIIFFTIIGAPLAMLLMMFFGIALFVGGIYVCLFAGRQLCKIFTPRSTNTPGYLCFTIGMIILVVLSFIPIFGYILTLAVMMLGLGGLVLAYWNSRT